MNRWLLVFLLTAAPAAGQTSGPVDASRAGSDRVVTATRISKALVIDGRFDDEVYQTVRPAGDFIQQDPREGEPASEPTELWILFDEDTLYISGKCYDSHPEIMISTEMRRDNNGGSRQMISSVRLRWEYRSGSELFIVYSDGRDTTRAGYPDLLNRSVAFKMTRLLRF